LSDRADGRWPNLFPGREPGLWLEDVTVGATYTTDAYELTDANIIAFGSEFDPQPAHVDPELARATSFEGLAASGWQVGAVTMRLLVTSGMPIGTGWIGAGVDLNRSGAVEG
jgi:acyl dehydratase